MELYKNSGILLKYFDKNLDFLTGYEKLLKLDFGQKGLFLSGKHGVGKTAFMNLYFKHVIDESLKAERKDRKTVRIIKLHDLIELYLTRNKNKEFNVLADSIDFVGIDDIDDVCLLGNAKEMNIMTLNYFVRRRFENNGLTTWFTSNTDFDDLVKTFGMGYGFKFMSFLKESTYIVQKTGNDFRDNFIEKFKI